MIQNSNEKEILPYCKENNIGFIPYSPLAQGMLSGKIDSSYILKSGDIREHNPIFNNQENFKNALDFVKSLKNPVEDAFNYLIEREEISTIIVGVSKRKNLINNLDIINSK